MSSQRRRNYVEKIEFREELAEFLEQNKEKYDEYVDEDSWKEIYNDYINDGGYDDFHDDWYDDYYIDDSYYDDDDYYVESSYEHYDWTYDDDIPYPHIKPGNHVRDKTNNTYIVAQDHKLVNILTGEYTYIHLLDGPEIIL